MWKKRQGRRAGDDDMCTVHSIDIPVESKSGAQFVMFMVVFRCLSASTLTFHHLFDEKEFGSYPIH
jgi:hypothetical protein